MTGSREVITGGDFKRMVSGAYSEFLLEYETINALGGAGTLAGTHILRTMGAAVMPLADAKDDSIGGLARRVSTAAVFGARGNAGVVLAQMFRGISAGLVGKYEATGSEFGKAFQYGILYAQRLVPEEPDRPFITVAKAVAKGAYHAVRDGMPIVEILYQAIQAGEVAVNEMEHGDAGANIMLSFLKGCLKGLDGNFVSPAVSLSLGLGTHKNMPDPRNDLVRPYCIRLRIKNSKASLPELERQMRDFSSFCSRPHRPRRKNFGAGNRLGSAVGNQHNEHERSARPAVPRGIDESRGVGSRERLGGSAETSRRGRIDFGFGQRGIVAFVG